MNLYPDTEFVDKESTTNAAQLQTSYLTVLRELEWVSEQVHTINEAKVLNTHSDEEIFQMIQGLSTHLFNVKLLKDIYASR